MENLDKNKIITFPNARSIKNRQKFLQKVDRWLVKRYSISLQFLEPYHIDRELFSKLMETSYKIQGGKVLLPVRDGTELLGCLVLSPTQSFKKENVKTLLELVSGVVSPFLRHLKQAEQTRLREQRLNHRINDGATLSLFNNRSAGEEGSDSIAESIPPLYIEGSCLEAIRRQALASHEEQKTLFFLPFDQIDAEKRLQAEELRSLGRTTIYVGDLGRYERKDLGAILDLLRRRSRYDSEFPFIIFGSLKPLEEIERQLKLSIHESDIISANSIFISQ